MTDAELVLRALRVIDNRNAVGEGEMPPDEYERLLAQEADEAPGGWLALTDAITGFAVLAVRILAQRTEGATFADVMQTVRNYMPDDE